MDVPAAIQLSRATLRNIKQNLFWALVYKRRVHPGGAGALAFAGVNLNRMIAAAANELGVRGVDPRLAGGSRGSYGALALRRALGEDPEPMMCQHCVSRA